MVGRLRRLVEVETDARGRILSLVERSNGGRVVTSARQRRIRDPLVIERTRLE